MVQRLKFFVEQWFVASSIRGDSWFDSNQPVTFELNQIAIVRFEFESNLEASQVPTENVRRLKGQGLVIMVIIACF